MSTPTVGIVLVSHSAELAAGAALLASQVSGGTVSHEVTMPTTATWAPARRRWQTGSATLTRGPAWWSCRTWAARC